MRRGRGQRRCGLAAVCRHRPRRDPQEEVRRAASAQDACREGRHPRALSATGLVAGSGKRPARVGADPAARDGPGRHAARRGGARATRAAQRGVPVMRSVPFAPLDPALYRETVRRALAEDLGWGDVTTEATVDAFLHARGIILAKSDCVIAGLDVAAETFRQLDPGAIFTSKVVDGARCTPGAVVAEVRGSAAAMLTAERTALNFLQRLSGIASITRRYVDAAGGTITVLDTRKTTPTLRVLEK